MVKLITGIAALILLSQAGQAQGFDQPRRKLTPITHKLELDYPGKELSLELDRFEKPAPQISLRQQPKEKDLALSHEGNPEANLRAQMPVLKPDTTILFPILAVKPDSTVYYQLQVKKP